MLFILINGIFLNKTIMYTLNFEFSKEISQNIHDNVFYGCLMDLYYRNQDRYTPRISGIWLSRDLTDRDSFLNIFLSIIIDFKEKCARKTCSGIDDLNNLITKLKLYHVSYIDTIILTETIILKSKLTHEMRINIFLIYILSIFKLHIPLTIANKINMVRLVHKNSLRECFKVSFYDIYVSVHPCGNISPENMINIGFQRYKKIARTITDNDIYIDFYEPVIYFYVRLLSILEPVMIKYKYLIQSEQLLLNKVIEDRLCWEIDNKIDILKRDVISEWKKKIYILYH